MIGDTEHHSDKWLLLFGANMPWKRVRLTRGFVSRTASLHRVVQLHPVEYLLVGRPLIGEVGGEGHQHVVVGSGQQLETLVPSVRDIASLVPHPIVVNKHKPVA